MKNKEQNDFNITERIGIFALLVLLLILWFRKKKKDASLATASNSLVDPSKIEAEKGIAVGENDKNGTIINNSTLSIFTQIMQLYRTEMLAKFETINGKCYQYTGVGNVISTRANGTDRPLDQELFPQRFFVFYNSGLLNATQYSGSVYDFQLTITDSNITVSTEDTITICSF